MQSSPVAPHLQTIAPPASSTGIPLAGKSGKLQPIQANEWKSLSSNQRQTQFKAHYDAVHTSWKGITTFLEKSVDQAAQASSADPGNPSLKNLIANRKKALRQLKHYLFDKADPKMLDPMYLNQTREHLQDIHQQLGNEDIDTESRLGAVLELVQGLDVCKEGVALNILACAKNLNARTQGHPLAGLYRSARDELINQHLLKAVRASHATPVYANKQAGGQIVEFKDSEQPSHKALEIHEVQALRNALSKELGLQYLPDRYINPNYEKAIGSIAKSQIPQLITTHAVASRVADELLNWMRGTNLLSEQVLSVDGRSDKHLVVDVSGNQYKDLTTSLHNEMGVEASLLFDSPDDDFTKLALVSHEALTARLAEWIGNEQGKTGSPAQGLGEAVHHAVTDEQVNKAMSHFLEPVKRQQDNYPHIGSAVFKAALPEPAIDLLMPKMLLAPLDDRKKKEKEQQEIRQTQVRPGWIPMR